MQSEVKTFIRAKPVDYEVSVYKYSKTSNKKIKLMDIHHKNDDQLFHFAFDRVFQHTENESQFQNSILNDFQELLKNQNSLFALYSFGGNNRCGKFRTLFAESNPVNISGKSRLKSTFEILLQKAGILDHNFIFQWQFEFSLIVFEYENELKLSSELLHKFTAKTTQSVESPNRYIVKTSNEYLLFLKILLDFSNDREKRHTYNFYLSIFVENSEKREISLNLLRFASIEDIEPKMRLKKMILFTESEIFQKTFIALKSEIFEQVISNLNSSSTKVTNLYVSFYRILTEFLKKWPKGKIQTTVVYFLNPNTANYENSLKYLVFLLKIHENEEKADFIRNEAIADRDSVKPVDEFNFSSHEKELSDQKNELKSLRNKMNRYINQILIITGWTCTDDDEIEKCNQLVKMIEDDFSVQMRRENNIGSSRDLFVSDLRSILDRFSFSEKQFLLEEQKISDEISNLEKENVNLKSFITNLKNENITTINEMSKEMDLKVKDYQTSFQESNKILMTQFEQQMTFLPLSKELAALKSNFTNQKEETRVSLGAKMEANRFDLQTKLLKVDKKFHARSDALFASLSEFGEKYVAYQIEKRQRIHQAIFVKNEFLKFAQLFLMSHSNIPDIKEKFLSNNYLKLNEKEPALKTLMNFRDHQKEQEDFTSWISSLNLTEAELGRLSEAELELIASKMGIMY